MEGRQRTPGGRHGGHDASPATDGRLRRPAAMSDPTPEGRTTPTGGPVAPATVALALYGHLIRLLTAELVAAWNAALASGTTPAELVAIVAERRRAIRNM
jgi:hypothetical protein